jgi:hypothetical protein
VFEKPKCPLGFGEKGGFGAGLARWVSSVLGFDGATFFFGITTEKNTKKKLGRGAAKRLREKLAL